ncbi:MAG: tRNA lysidine(34) synthetase TilS [bacterium]
MEHNLIRHVREFASIHNLFDKGDKVLVAVSGGPDSTALLHSLLALQKEYGLTLVLAHLEHGIRGQESLSQAAFVRRMGNELRLDCIIQHYNVPRLREEKKYSLEEAARKARYNFLRETAQRVGATKIALGHTADDQGETILMRLIRGAGIEGLAGMRPKRHHEPPLIRPLLNIFRLEVLDFLHTQGIPFCVDSTNLEVNHLRNKIRLELIPMLKRDYNPQIVSALHRTASILGETRDLISLAVEEKLQQCLIQADQEAVSLNLHTLMALPLALQREVLRQAIHMVSEGPYKIDFTKVSLILRWLNQKRPRGTFRVSHTLCLRKQPGTVQVERKEPEASHPPEAYGHEVHIPGETKIPELNLRIVTRISDRSAIKKSELESLYHPHYALLDFDTLPFPLHVRNREPGDRFQPLGFHGTKKLKDFFIDAKVPVEERNRIPVIASGRQIVWVVGMRIADPFKITEKTKKILFIEKII